MSTVYGLLSAVVVRLHKAGTDVQREPGIDGHVLHHHVVSPSIENARVAIDAGYAEIEKLDKYLNNFSPDSEISAVSMSAGAGPVRVSKGNAGTYEKDNRCFF